MNEKEKRIIEAVAEAFPSMSEFDKGYMLGMVENNSIKRDKREAVAESKQKGA